MILSIETIGSRPSKFYIRQIIFQKFVDVSDQSIKRWCLIKKYLLPKCTNLVFLSVDYFRSIITVMTNRYLFINYNSKNVTSPRVLKEDNNRPGYSICNNGKDRWTLQSAAMKRINAHRQVNGYTVGYSPSGLTSLER